MNITTILYVQYSFLVYEIIFLIIESIIIII